MAATSDASNVAAAYVQLKRLELANEVRPKAKVYLDTKYWVDLREVRLGRSDSSPHKRLLSTLEELVAAGKVICPLNGDTFIEILKQNDATTLSASVQLMDDLSGGVSLISMLERIAMEIDHFVESSLAGPSSVFARDDLIWTKASYILGFTTPNFTGLSYHENVTLQKAVADEFWDVGLTDMLKTMGAEVAAKYDPSFPDISDWLNRGKFSSVDEHDSFKSLFLCEVRGVLDGLQEDLEEIILRVSERMFGISSDGTPEQRHAVGEMLSNQICNAFRLNKVGEALPSIRIGAGLHTALRWDRKRKYKANDMFDFRHAEAALPYCDYFFTERSLRHLVNDKNLDFPSRFQCQVCSDPSEALALTMELTS